MSFRLHSRKRPCIPRRGTNALYFPTYRVHSLSTLEKLTYQEAHDTEILAIDFTDSGAQDSAALVASAGRDRLLHIFDVQNDYALVQTLDDHSSSITCIKFAADGSRMMSCGADKSIIFRNCQKVNDKYSPDSCIEVQNMFWSLI